MKFIHHDTVIHTNIDLIKYNSCILKRIINEAEDNKKDSIIFESFLDHEGILFLFENLLLYPYFEPKTYNTYQDLCSNLKIGIIKPILEYYQMKNILILITDLINNEKEYDISELKVYFELKKYFRLTTLPLLNINIKKIVLKNIIEKTINIDDLDLVTRKEILTFIFNNVRQYYVYENIPSKYILDLDNR